MAEITAHRISWCTSDFKILFLRRGDGSWQVELNPMFIQDAEHYPLRKSKIQFMAFRSRREALQAVRSVVPQISETLCMYTAPQTQEYTFYEIARIPNRKWKAKITNPTTLLKAIPQGHFMYGWTAEEFDEEVLLHHWFERFTDLHTQSRDAAQQAVNRWLEILITDPTLVRAWLQGDGRSASNPWTILPALLDKEGEGV